MTTDVISSLAGTLDTELEKARENLRGVDSNIKKLFGKDFELSNFTSRSRRNFPNQIEYQQSDNYDANSFGHNRSQTRKRNDYDRHDRDDEPGEKRRRVDSGRDSNRPPPVVASRLRPHHEFEEDNYDHGHSGREGSGRRLQSRVVSSSKEKSREDVLAEQSKDRRGRDRNRRMFGALLGTLQRFKQEETKLKTKEEKRAQIEAKLDEAAKREKEEVKKEKQQLIRDRKLQMTEIKRLEIKRRRIAELEQWEAKTRYLTNFIRTESKPHIFYLPKILNPITECRLDQSKQYVTEMIASKRKIVLEDLEDFEQRSRRYWESRVDGDSAKKGDVDPMDEDMEFELKEIMKNEENIVLDEDLEDGEDFTVTVFENKKEPTEIIAEREEEEPTREEGGDAEEEDEAEGGEREEILVETVSAKVNVTEEVEEEEDDDDEQEQEADPDNEDGDEMNEDSKENLN